MCGCRVLQAVLAVVSVTSVVVPAPGGDVPFTERVISNAANRALSVFATDMDGDGDTDVLSASQLDSKVAWYESDGGSPPAFTEHVISTTAPGARAVFATDLDGAGDTDVLSASGIDDKIAWYENTMPPQDSDGDGVPDDVDNCPDSDLAESIMIDDWDTGVGNELFDDGCTMADLIMLCAEDAANHGRFVSCVGHLANEWKHQGLITGREKGRIQKCAAQADVP